MSAPTNIFRAIAAGCILWPAFWLILSASIWPMSVRLAPPGHEPWILWASGFLLRRHWALAGLNAAGTFLLWTLILRLGRRLEPDQRRRVRYLSPLLLTAFVFSALLLKDVLPPGIAANALFYLPVLAVSFSLARVAGRWTSRDTSSFSPGRTALLGIVFSAAFWLTGMAHTRWSGLVSGDEGHYMIQAVSLHQDGDLDIRNQYEASLGDRCDDYIANDLLADRLHVSPRSRGNRWYSYHAPGLAFLSAWTVPHGDWARHLVLCLTAGLAIAGMYILCGMAGAGSRASLVVILLYAVGLYNAVYASRFLPEMLGATLVLWLTAAIFAQERRFFPSAIGAAAIVSALPWAQLRFLPMALLGAALYILHGLLIKEHWKNKVARLVVFAALSGAGLLMYRHFQLVFFEDGLSHGVGSLFMEYPAGIIRTFTNPGGLADVFPLAVLLVPCGLLGWRLNREQRPLLIGTAALFLTTWIATCSGGNYGGGACVPGRFLVSVMPLLIPALALYWGRASGIERWWLILLGLVSAGLCILELAILPRLGPSFVEPYNCTPIVLPALWGWRLPWPGPNFIFAAALVHAILVFRNRKTSRLTPWLIGLLLATLLAAQFSAAGRPSNEMPHHRAAAARGIADFDLAAVRIQPRRETGSVRLFTISNFLTDRFDRGRDADNPLRITTERRNAVHENDTISQPLLDRNDWDEERGWQWATLWPPRAFGGGQMAFSLQGRIIGGARPVVALREGSRTIVEQQLSTGTDGRASFQYRFNVQSRDSLLYMLVHLEGEGEFITDELALSPVSDNLLMPDGFTE